MDTRDPDAVVMAIGGNDGFNVEAGGQLYGPGDPEWQTEFARRVAVVAKTFSGDGERPVYWVPPPTARDSELNEIYATQNRAVEQAVAAVPGLRYVDVYSTLGRRQVHGQPEDRRAQGARAPVGRGPLQRARARSRRRGSFSRRWRRTTLRSPRTTGPESASVGSSVVPRWAQPLLLAAALLMLLVPAAPSATLEADVARTRNLLVNGDSLAVGTAPYIPARAARAGASASRPRSAATPSRARP